MTNRNAMRRRDGVENAQRVKIRHWHDIFNIGNISIGGNISNIENICAAGGESSSLRIQSVIGVGNIFIKFYLGAGFRSDLEAQLKPPSSDLEIKLLPPNLILDLCF